MANQPSFQTPAGRDRMFQHLQGGDGDGCACTGNRRTRRARTRPFPLGATAGATVTYNNTSFHIPGGSKLRLGNSQDAIITSITVDDVALPRVQNLPASILDPAKVLGNPVDFVMPEINSSIIIVFSAAPANPIVAYLENVPISVVTKCEVVDDGADVRAERGGVSAQPSIG